ncbi:MAG: hypothetical protein IT434_12940 [Phycisphaerales bacterium]|nr:hypothetical protein [Phycisphaerales bacterium]
MSDEIDHRAMSGRRSRLWMVAWLSAPSGVVMSLVLVGWLGMPRAFSLLT